MKYITQKSLCQPPIPLKSPVLKLPSSAQWSSWLRISSADDLLGIIEAARPLHFICCVPRLHDNALESRAMACVGPGLMMVTQVKNFSQNSSLSF
jgi:hypothetical protein